MSQQYKAAAEVIKGAIVTLNAILVGPEDEMHRLKLSQSLQHEADYLLLVTGAGDLTENKDAVVLGPATTIGGRPIAKLPRITERDLKPSDDAVLNLKEQVESALVYFGPDSDAAGILANIPDLVVRGVAKKAGLKVTKDQPKELTVEFIDEIKAALLAKGLVPSIRAEDKDLQEKYLSEKSLPLVVGQGGLSEAHIVTSEDLTTTEEQQLQAEPVIIPPTPAEKVPDEQHPQPDQLKADTKKKTGK